VVIPAFASDIEVALRLWKFREAIYLIYNLLSYIWALPELTIYTTVKEEG